MLVCLLVSQKFHLGRVEKITFRSHGTLQSMHHPSLYNKKLFSLPTLLPPKTVKFETVKTHVKKKIIYLPTCEFKPPFGGCDLFTQLLLKNRFPFFFFLLNGSFWLVPYVRTC